MVIITSEALCWLRDDVSDLGYLLTTVLSAKCRWEQMDRLKRTKEKLCQARLVAYLVSVGAGWIVTVIMYIYCWQ